MSVKCFEMTLDFRITPADTVVDVGFLLSLTAAAATAPSRVTKNYPHIFYKQWTFHIVRKTPSSNNKNIVKRLRYYSVYLRVQNPFAMKSRLWHPILQPPYCLNQNTVPDCAIKYTSKIIRCGAQFKDATYSVHKNDMLELDSVEWQELRAVKWICMDFQISVTWRFLMHIPLLARNLFFHLSCLLPLSLLTDTFD